MNTERNRESAWAGLIERTGLGDLPRRVGVLFWVWLIGALIAALTLPKTRRSKAAATLVVGGLFAAFPGCWAWEDKPRRDAARAHSRRAEAMFRGMPEYHEIEPVCESVREPTLDSGAKEKPKEAPVEEMDGKGNDDAWRLAA